MLVNGGGAELNGSFQLNLDNKLTQSVPPFAQFFRQVFKQKKKLVFIKKI